VLLIGGKLVPIRGVTSVVPWSHGGPAWACLDPGDYRARRTRWVRQIVVHTTKGIWPQTIRRGAGPDGRDRRVADYWHRDPEHSAAHIVVDSDGSVACLTDLATTAAYHATTANDVSVGIEMHQEVDGSIYESVLNSTVATVLAICDAMLIADQFAADPYRAAPIQRLIDDDQFCGIYGHRNNTSRRGRGDPGDEIWHRLELAGVEPVQVGQHQDVVRSRQRQAHLVSLGAAISVDGVVGPRSIQAARSQGFARWSDVPLQLLG
jgi:hypothetical protein